MAAAGAGAAQVRAQVERPDGNSGQGASLTPLAGFEALPDSGRLPMKAKLVATLFSLPFLGVGLWMLWSISSTLYDAARMRDWQPVEARLLSAGHHTRRGDESDTYEAYAEFTYKVGGRTFRGNRVTITGGGDNIGDYQRDIGRRLAAALAAGEPITVYVDPEDPGSAIIDRGVRWGLVGFKSIFVFVFGGVGAGILYAVTRRRPQREPSDPAVAGAPWLLKDDWQSATLRSGSRARMWAAWAIAALWNAISAPLWFVAWQEITARDNWLALLALLFPLVGIGLIAWALGCTREWRRFGNAPLTLDPFPGAIGGHVGGSIDLALPFDPSARFEVTLTAIHSYMSGSGEDRSRRESAEWQDTRLAHAEPGGHGTRLSFRFDVPDGLDESDAVRDGDSYRLWRLNLCAELPGSDLDRDYDIPVYATGARSASLPERALGATAAGQEALTASRMLERFRATQTAGGTRLEFPMGRHTGSALGGAVIGSAFAVGGWFLWTEAGSPLFGIVFGGVGGLIALACLYLLLNSLEVFQDGTDIVSVRRLLGLPVRRRRLARDHIARLRHESKLQSQSGGKHVMHYTLYAVGPDGSEIVVGEGFRGAGEAQAAARFFAERFGLRRQVARRSVSATDEDPLAADA